MVLPVIVITCLAPIGMLLPANSGEKMGLQITLLLTLVVFIESLQDQGRDANNLFDRSHKDLNVVNSLTTRNIVADAVY